MKDNTERINELALKLKNGDKSVFDELYSLTCSKAYFIAMQICGDEHEAEDIVQDSYITALSKISTLEKTESFMSWFNRIVANRSKDSLKKRKPRVFSDDEEKAFSVIADEKTEFSPEDNVDRDELRSAVMDAIKELGAEKRACVLMKYFEDMSVNEIADSMDVPVSTVKNRLMAARRELKNLFERRGLTAAYSVAPFGAVAWALNSTFEMFSQSFESSASAAKILSGIAVASAAATGTAAATAGSAAAGSGIFAKAAAASTVQKIVSGIVVAGVVTGSTVGITSVVKNKKAEDNIPTVSYTETVENTAFYEPEETPAVNILNPEPNENGEEYEEKFVGYEKPGRMPEKVGFKGKLRLGNNHVDFEDGEDTYYVNFSVDEPGYYLITCDRKDYRTFVWVFFPEESENGLINDFFRAEISSAKDHGQMKYFEAGNHTLLVSRTEGMDSSDIDVEYLGEEITDIVIDRNDLDNVVLGYDEVREDGLKVWFDQSVMEEGSYGNLFRTKIIFSSGKVYDRGNVSLRYRVKDGGKLKEGKNTVIFALAEHYGFDKEFEITAHPVTDYVKNIEVTNLEEFCTVKINEEGFVYDKPENFDVIVTYADGSKETFDGATWDKFLKIKDGVLLYVTFNRARETMTMDYRLRGRESLHFRVSIGETDYIDEVCTVNEFDVIGYRRRLNENNLEEAREYTAEIENGIELMKENTDSIEDFIRYSAELSKVTAYNSYKIFNRIAGFELDYAITTFKILTENEFDLIDAGFSGE